MLSLLPNQVPTSFKDEFEIILENMESEDEVQKHKDEIFAVWFASPFVKQVCISQPAWLHELLKNKELFSEFTQDNYANRLNSIFLQTNDTEELQRLLRKIRAAEYARIAWRDLQGYASVQQTLNELSLFAQTCLAGTLEWCFNWLKAQPRVSEYERTLQNRIVIFALGKLGGKELNFSSDVDLVFAYSEVVEHTQEQSATAASFYLKLIQHFIKVISEQTEDGFVFRVDTRLRPFGNSGALVPTFSAIEQYFQTHGRDWERYAWIKARVIAGDVKAGEEFLKEVTPFIYRRYLDYGAVQSLRAMKELVDVKAKQNTAKVDVKIGQGGIREIEFIAQMFQLIYGGRNKNLQIRCTLDVLKCLEKLGMLSHEKINDLVSAYLYLRNVENGLQFRNDQQTHKLPNEEQSQHQFAYLISADNWNEFYKEYKKHTANVSYVFNSLLHTDEDDDESETAITKEFIYLWQQIDDKQYCTNILEKYFAKNSQSIYERLCVFSKSNVIQQLVQLARKRLDEFIPIFLINTLKLSDPDSV